MGEPASKYRGAVGLSFYGYAHCCGSKLTARSIDVMDAKLDEHRARCPKAQALAALRRARPAVQEQLELEAPHAG